MKYIKNGKVVLDGTIRQCDLEEKIFKAFEIIFEKNVDMIAFKNSNKASYYNMQRNPGSKALKGIEFKTLKEVLK